MSSQQYRLYCLNGSGGINLADWIEANNDDDAVIKARQMQHGAIKAEVWQRNRLVARLDNQDLSVE